MYPDVKPRHGDTGPAQRGFLMPLAIFILVAMGFFAITISRVTGQTAIATTQEAVSVASFYAAESGAQYAMNQLFYDAGSAISRASIACTRNTDAANTTSYYLVQSQAGCGSASVTAQRSVEISATMK